LKVLVWQWGRRGAGPRYAAELAHAFAREPDASVRLSLSTGAELLQTDDPPACALPVRTYSSLAGYIGRMLGLPALVIPLVRWLRRERIDIAVCAMPAAMDLAMAAALKLAGVPYVVVVHDADLHPGDRFAAQIFLQRWLVRGAHGVFALSAHVAGRLREQSLPAGCALMRSTLPPFHYGSGLPAPRSHGAALHLLSFGRLLPYKGLDLLAAALEHLGPRSDLVVRVVGSGPESADLERLRAMPGVTVENRWVAESEIAALYGWADGVILSHREASQSGIAAAAIAARRWIVATRVGGLAEQLEGESQALLCEPDAASLASAIRVLLAREPPIEPEVARLDRSWPEIAHSMVADLRRIATGS
jgi:glycosyltransferase involved in cell wall biosynthesis